MFSTKTLFSICQFSIVCHLKLFPKCIEHYWFMAYSAKKKGLKSFRRWVPMNFHATKKLLQIVFHDLWTWDWKIVFHGIWNPRACIQSKKCQYNRAGWWREGCKMSAPSTLGLLVRWCFLSHNVFFTFNLLIAEISKSWAFSIV